MTGRITYNQAKRENRNRPTCPICFKPGGNSKVCDSCYNDLSRSGNLLEKKEKEVCNQTPTSK